MCECKCGEKYQSCNNWNFYRTTPCHTMSCIRVLVFTLRVNIIEIGQDGEHQPNGQDEPSKVRQGRRYGRFDIPQRGLCHPQPPSSLPFQPDLCKSLIPSSLCSFQRITAMQLRAMLVHHAQLFCNTLFLYVCPNRRIRDSSWWQ